MFSEIKSHSGPPEETLPLYCYGEGKGLQSIMSMSECPHKDRSTGICVCARAGKVGEGFARSGLKGALKDKRAAKMV